MLQAALVSFFPFLMIYSAFSDLVSMTIPNKVSLALIAGFVLFAWWTGMDLETFVWHWALFAAVLVASIALFAFGHIGGGDAKLAAATVLWLGWDHALSYLFIASLIGAALTLVMMRLRGNIIPGSVEKVEWIARLYRADSGIPYGIALGAAAIVIYPQTRWMEPVFNLALPGM
ncbi:A24 family peptidase [Salaquimonas pukyongi]|uniref:A24 family peptidase n=1 Tax=Salaquimonas pukyongi TaxID=2712698 RepID=UPI00096B7562|nr:prepilin peptidase [Salaquimonas pukyongi]